MTRTIAAPKTTDGIMAVNINTGEFLWAYQATENDVFMGGCNGPVKSEACPTPMGPDMDIGNSPILKTLPGGKRVLIGGTKGGDVFGIDPDNRGALLYRVNVGGGTVGGNGKGVERDGGVTVGGGGATAVSSRYTACGWHLWTGTGLLV